MRETDSRILEEHGIQPSLWAVLRVSSNFFYTPLKEFMIKLELEQAECFSEYELWKAIDLCMQQGLIYEDDEGILLTDEGQQFKEDVEATLYSGINIFAGS